MNEGQDAYSLFMNSAREGMITREAFRDILHKLGIPDQKTDQIVADAPEQISKGNAPIDYNSYYEVLMRYQSSIEPIEQEQPQQQQQPVAPPSQPPLPPQPIQQQKYSSSQLAEIMQEFKIAIRSQNLERVDQIIKQYKDIDIVNRLDTQTRQISTFYAVLAPDENAAHHMLYMLCEAGAEVNFKDNLRQNIAFYACRDGREKIIDYLVSKGIKIDDTDAYNQTPLFYAARENRIEVVNKLIKYGCNLNHVDSLHGQTCLFYAAREGHVEMCKILIENGCKVNHQDSNKKTALFYAKKSSRKEVIDLLNSYMSKMKDEIIKKDSNVQSNPLESSKGEQKQIRKKNKEIPKQAYKLLYTDDKGNQRELTSEDFNKFQSQFPEVANLIMHADDLIDDTMVNQAKEDETWEKIAKKILNTIWKAKGAYFFHSPVDPKKYGIIDYFDIVKKPMDFGTIKHKLNSNVYKSCKEFHNEMQLVFENCILYNGTKSDVGQIGVSIQNEYHHLVETNGLQKYL